MAQLPQLCISLMHSPMYAFPKSGRLGTALCLPLQWSDLYSFE